MTATADLFASVAEAERPHLLGIAGKIAGYAQAEDVVQTALLNAWQRRLAGGGEITGGAEGMALWLRQVVRGAALDARRYEWARPWNRPGATVEDGPFWLGALPDPETPEEVVERRETSAEARAFVLPILAQLSPVYREVLWTTYGAGRGQREAAALLGKRWTAVKTLRDRARLKCLKLAGVAATASSA